MWNFKQMRTTQLRSTESGGQKGGTRTQRTKDQAGNPTGNPEWQTFRKACHSFWPDHQESVLRPCDIPRPDSESFWGQHG